MATSKIKATPIIKVDIDFSTATDASQKSVTVNGNWVAVIGSRAINKYGNIYSNHKGELYTVGANRVNNITTVFATPNNNQYYGGVASCRVYLTSG